VHRSMPHLMNTPVRKSRAHRCAINEAMELDELHISISRSG
jgi:hypothetical protein